MNQVFLHTAEGGEWGGARFRDIFPSSGMGAATALLMASLVAFLGGTGRCPGQTETIIAIDPSITYQTIGGWGCVSSLPTYLTPEFRVQLLDEVVNEYGLTRMRLEPPAGNSTGRRRWEWLNDNDTSETTAWTSLNLAALDGLMEELVLPFAARVQANRDPFEMYVSFSFYNGGSSGTVPAWLLNNPAEYIEFTLSLLNRLKFRHGLEPDYLTILNEPAYDNNFTAPIVRELVKSLGPRMEAAGFGTRIQYPEALNIDAAYNTFVAPFLDDDELWMWIGAISYHRYGGATQLGNLVSFAQSKGIRTSFTEQLATGLNLDMLYTDLTTGMNSTWEIYSIGSEINIDQQHFNFFEPGNGGYYWRFRQIFHYVRPGAVRVRAMPDPAGSKALAFLKDGRTTVIFYGLGTSTVTLRGLTPGLYGLCSARLTAAYVERGPRTVGADGVLTLSGLDTVPLYTLYPRSTENMAPVFTSFKPSAPYLVAPASSFTLTAAAQDPDLNALSYTWEVARTPPGASVTLATPDAASCLATGLNEPGDYAFTVTARDGHAATRREVRMRVFAGNPAPEILEIHNRSAVQLQLPSTTTTQLRCSVFNVDNDPLTYAWSIVSTPPGGSVTLAEPTLDRTQVNGFSVAGDYVFRLTVSDGVTTVSADHTVPVYPANSVLNVSASATPTSITLPTSTVQLHSVSSDSDGDGLSHWWRLVSSPVGGTAVFHNQAAAATGVTGLIVPGVYSFEHVVSDRFTFKKSSPVVVTVAAGTAPAQFALLAPHGGETYEPGQTVRIRWKTAHFSGPVSLSFFDGTQWNPIAESIPNDGVEEWIVPDRSGQGFRIRLSDPHGAVPAVESAGEFAITVPDEFRILSFSLGNDDVAALEWSSLPGGYAYQVLYSETLQPADWRPLGTPQVAQTGQFRMTLDDPDVAGAVRRFYKVVRTPID